MQKLPLLCMVLPFFLSACEGLTSTQANPNVHVYEAQPHILDIVLIKFIIKIQVILITKVIIIKVKN